MIQYKCMYYLRDLTLKEMIELIRRFKDIQDCIKHNIDYRKFRYIQKRRNWYQQIRQFNDKVRSELYT
jgi:hypothetical protein